MNEVNKFKVLMFGPRECGKTSVLTAMNRQFGSVTKLTTNNISITPDEDTSIIINNNLNKLEKIFKTKTVDSESWQIAEEQTKKKRTYDYNLSFGEAENRYELEFTDIPGEWLTDESHRKEVNDLIENSDVFILAVDTPHAVEDKNPSDPFNNPYVVNSFFKGFFNETNKPRLMLVVPLKCEKYYYEGRMNEVNEAVLSKYKNLFSQIKERPETKNLFTVAITPILSLGGVVFDDFERDENGDIVRVNNDDDMSLFARPQGAYYKIYKENPCYSPKYCEQPILYILNFIIHTAKIVTETTTLVDNNWKNRLKRLMQIRYMFIYELLNGTIKRDFIELFSNKRAVSVIEQTFEYVKTSGDGYSIVHDPFDFATKAKTNKVHISDN